MAPARCRYADGCQQPAAAAITLLSPLPLAAASCRQRCAAILAMLLLSQKAIVTLKMLLPLQRQLLHCFRLLVSLAE